jgi:hypothetical protein
MDSSIQKLFKGQFTAELACRSEFYTQPTLKESLLCGRGLEKGVQTPAAG